MTDGASPSMPLCSRNQLLSVLGDLTGKRAVVLGLGLFGGGEGAARFLAERGAQVCVTDKKEASRLAPALERLDDLPIRYRLGEHRQEDLTEADLVVVNPAVPRDCDLLQTCHAAGVPLASPMNLFLSLCPAPAAAVTGSAGKSTTTAMLAAMLRAGERSVHLGGNMGISLLPRLEEIRPDDIVVLELSSVQLEDAACLPWSPHAAIITNITPNHLDRYGTFHAYAAAKKNILTFQNHSDLAVLNRRDSTLRRWGDDGTPGRLLYFDTEGEDGDTPEGTCLRGGRLMWNDGRSRQVICTADQIPLPGNHNVANALAASAAARWLGVPARRIRGALQEFSALEHRLEECARVAGMTFYNDSDSTTPESTTAGLKSFDGPLTLIAGGYNKDLDLRPLARAIVEHVEVLITLGTSGPDIAQGTREAGLHAGSQPVIREVESLADAIDTAFDLSMPGSTVLFSPACASFDMFENFAQRGRRFKELVAQRANHPPEPNADCA